MKQPNNSSKTPIREQIVFRSKWLVWFMYSLTFVVVGRIVYLQTVKKEDIMQKVAKFLAIQRIDFAERGNIYAADGKSVLATTVPKYTLVFDPFLPSDTIRISRKDRNLPDSLVLFKDRLDSLAYYLTTVFPEKSKEDFINPILAKRKAKKRYLELMPRLITAEEKNSIQHFPFFRKNSREKGGEFRDEKIRVYPFGQMAKRTIGKVRTDTTKGIFGLELSFDKYLAGRNGIGKYNEIASNKWQATEITDKVQPEIGKDIVSTIDVNLQDIAESALLKQLMATNAKYGTVVVMEIKTGEIKAIANYGRQIGANGNITYADDKNYAVVEGTDPGSTFKLASMIALLEKANLNPNDYAANCLGEVVHNSKLTLKCSHAHGNQTVRQAFENSCNVGFYQLIKKHFGFSKNSEFVNYLEPLRLTEKVPYQLRSKFEPILKKTTDKNFTNSTIPWMSIGYELRLTPMEMLAMYNAVANNGYWVEPILVKEVRDANTVTQRFEATKAVKPFCSERTIKLVKSMMEGVVERGTANNIKEGYCKVAGKTGTAQKQTANKNYREGKLYYTSFIGYFPANNPKYSCIVAIDEPEFGSLYGNTIAAPVFRTIADKIFTYDINIHESKQVKSNMKYLAQEQKSGVSSDFAKIQEKLQLPYPVQASNKLVVTKQKPDGNIGWQELNKSANLPDVKGMVLRDALAILENKGLKVRYSGKGKVEDMQRQEGNYVLLSLR